MKILIYSLAIFFLLFFTNCKKDNLKQSNIQNPVTSQFIHPAFKEIDVPITEYSIIGEVGDIIQHKTGSILRFPQNAFINSKGEILKGEIKLKYREFVDPIDFFISGIPMNYDSAQLKFVFESFGMFELFAFKDNKPVYVNPKSKPQINFITSNSDTLNKVYMLDTLNKKWVEKGKSRINEISKHSSLNDSITNKKSLNALIRNEQENLVVPIKPLLANNDRPIFTVDISALEYLPELKIFQNTKFEVDISEKKYSPKASIIEWDDVKLINSETPGIYIITFISGRKKISYRVRAVFEVNDYKEALKIFELQQKAYEKKLLVLEKQKREKLLELSKIEANRPMVTKIYRIFELDSFGIWNWDRPFRPNVVPFCASFKNIEGKELDLTNITLVYKKFNVIVPYSNCNLKAMPNDDIMIWGIDDGKFAYLTYDDYKKCGITSEINEYTFTMRTHPNQIKSREDIKMILGL